MYNPEDKELNDRAENIIRNEVLCCDSMLVSWLLRSDLGNFNWDDVENLTPDPSDWTLEQCEKHCKDYGLGEADTYGMCEGDDDYLEAWREHIEDNGQPAEVFEWWRVTQSLCEDLRELGEVVLENDYGYWWGRTTTGQAIVGDGAFQEVVKLIQKRYEKVAKSL